MAIPRLPGSPNSDNDKPKSVSDKAISPSPVAMPEPPAAMPDMPAPANDMPPMPDYIPEDPDEIPSLEDAPEVLGAPDEPDMPELDIPAYQEPEPFDPRAETEPASDDNMLSFQEMLDLEDKPWWQQPAQSMQDQPMQPEGGQDMAAMVPQFMAWLQETMDPDVIRTIAEIAANTTEDQQQ